MSVTYQVRRSLAGAGDWQVVATDITESSYRDGGLTVDTAYDYQVRACNAGGCSEWSEIATATPIDLRYDVRQSLSGADDWTIIATGLSETEYLATDLQAGTGYDFQVRACYQGACSAWSDIASATTPGAPIELASRFGLGVGMRGALAADAATLLAARFGVGIGVAADIEHATALAARFALGLGARAALSDGATLLAARLTLGLGISADLERIEAPSELAAQMVLGLGLRGEIGRIYNLAARMRIGLAVQQRSLGPGDGLVVVLPDDLIYRLREGDTFPVHLPWAGIAGMSGLGRVLSRTVRDDGRPALECQFVPYEQAVPAQREGQPPRYQPETRHSVSRRIHEQGRALDRLHVRERELERRR